MHRLHDYVAKQLTHKIETRGVVIWYDERGEFVPFVSEIREGAGTGNDPALVSVGEASVHLIEYAGSMFELRAVVEPFVKDDSPVPTVVYIPGCARDRRSSVLMELERAGTTWEPQLKQLARNLLLQDYTLGVVDEMLPFDRKVTYADLASATAGGGSEAPSILKSIFHDSSSTDALLASWIVSDARDGDIGSKDATRELVKLISSRLGLEQPGDVALPKLRAVTLRYVLANDFRCDLSCEPPGSLGPIPVPPSKNAESAVQELARFMRASFPDAYAHLADRVEGELRLRDAKLPSGALGAIDTFRFEESALLQQCSDLIASGRFEEALRLVAEREHSFWLDRDVGRKAQWEASRRMAELGTAAALARAAVSKTDGDVAAWFNAYTSKNGWYRLDQAQRRLEAWVANLDEEPEERSLGLVRRAYDDACQAMAIGFTKAMVKAGWIVRGALHQTRIFSEVVAAQPSPVAYFLVDAMRFEMGIELAERLPRSSEVSIRPAVAALPSITPMGMAALQPAAASNYSVIEQNGKLGAKIEDAFLPDLASRKKFAAARVPKLVDVALDELMSLQPSKLTKKLDGAQVIIVRSQEIDHAGEAGFTFQARHVMDTVIDNLARAIRRLARVGVEHAVISADHGHLFFASDRDESMRTDPPGGYTVELHRRCWIGRGGMTPPGCVRVAASALGYDSDLEFVFPAGCGIFRAGGDLAFHHGGPSLQELVIPVLTVRTKAPVSTHSSSGPIVATGLPETITNRIFSVTLSFAEHQLPLGVTDVLVRPLLMAVGKQVGAVGMVVDAQFDRATGCVKLESDRSVTVAFLLNDESVAFLSVVVQDPATDAELYRSPTDIPVRLGVQ
jgi:hypothetical protein